MRPRSPRGLATHYSPETGLSLYVTRAGQSISTRATLLPTEPGYQNDLSYQLAEQLGYQTQTGIACPTCPTQPFEPMLTADTESRAVRVPVQNNLLDVIEVTSGERAALVNSLADPLALITTGWVLSKHETAVYGHYLGWTLRGTDPPFRVETVELEYAPTRSWDTT